MKECIRVVVTGDVNAGKSTLIGRLLYQTQSVPSSLIEGIRRECEVTGRAFEFAYLLDSFEEERKDQFTLDTTQVFCRTPGKKDIIFIDVPGHRELLGNMLSGTSYADAALFVIDAQKSVREQASRHMFILKFLGIEYIILALNKMDTIGFDKAGYEKITRDLIAFSRELDIHPRCIIPVSAREGDNLSQQSERLGWYRGPVVLKALDLYRKKKQDDNFRFVIQDIYKIRDNRVAVGTIVRGRIRKGDCVTLLPEKRKIHIEQIRVFNKAVRAAQAPESIGLVFDAMRDARRGQVLCASKKPEVTRSFSTRICCVRDFTLDKAFELRVMYQKTSARITELGSVRNVGGESRRAGGRLQAFDFAAAVINTEEPVVIEKSGAANGLGRFILKDNTDICAAGICVP